MLQGFEWYLPEDGTHWNSLKNKAKELSDMGINHIWLPPAYKGANGASSVGYDVYDTYDLGEFDQKGSIRTKYGTRKEYLDCIKSMQKNNIKVLGDIVLNHMMGADDTEEVLAEEEAGDNRNYKISGQQTITVWTKFEFPGRNGKYSKRTWNHENFSGTDWDQGNSRNGIFSFDGKSWNGETDSENGNFDYLMGADLDMDNPDTVEALNEWGKWYLDTTKMDGMRLDAVKHIEFAFYKKWISEMRDYKGDNFFVVGEYWSNELGKLLHYLDSVENTFSLFDVPLHFNMYEAANSNGNYDLGSLRNNTLTSNRPMNSVTFVDNHDTQIGQALCSYVPAWFKPIAYALILLQRDGVPCVFYGDLYGIEHDNIDPIKELPTLIRLRKTHAYGEERSYFDDSNIVGFTRSGDLEHEKSGLAVLMNDNCEGSKYMVVNPEFAGMTVKNVFGEEEIALDENGGAVFTVSGGNVSVWIRG